MPKAKYFHELSLDKMLEYHDWFYQYSDDHRYYKKGSEENKIIHEYLLLLLPPFCLLCLHPLLAHSKHFLNT